jgi:PRC-barrel domain protein
MRRRLIVMRVFSRVCLMAVLALIPAYLFVMSPAAGQPSSRKTLTEDTAQPPPSPSLGEGTIIETQKLGTVLGIEVRTETERNVGRIVDLLANRNGQVEAAVVEFGGFLGMGARKIAIEWSAIHFEPDGKKTVAVLDIPRDRLRVAPEYKPEQPIVVQKIIPQEPSSATAPPEEATAPLPPPKKEPSTKRKRRHHTSGRDW